MIIPQHYTAIACFLCTAGLLLSGIVLAGAIASHDYICVPHVRCIYKLISYMPVTYICINYLFIAAVAQRRSRNTPEAPLSR